MNAMKRRNRICKRSNRSRNLPVGGASLALAAGFEPSCGDRSSRGRWTAAGAAVCLAGLLPVVTTTPAYATLRYNITVLAAPSGGGSYAFGVNTSGQVVGDVGTYGNYHAFLYSNGIMTDLGTLGGAASYARGINNSGQIAGYSSTSSGYWRPFTYSNGAMVAEVPGGGFNNGEALAINNYGQTAGVGWNYVPGQTYASSNGDAYFTYPSGLAQGLGTLGGYNSVATAINDAAQVVGYSNPPYGNAPYHAFIYSNGIMTDLGTLGGAASYARGINDLGQVAGGASTTAAGNFHAFLFSNGTMTDLGTLGGSFSIANGINNSGQVVGESTMSSSSGAGAAFLYSSGVMYNLNSLVPTGSGLVLETATAINSNGDIVGYGEYNYQFEAFLLTPSTPEPGGFQLLAAFTASVMLLRRKKSVLRLAPSTAPRRDKPDAIWGTEREP